MTFNVKVGQRTVTITAFGRSFLFKKDEFASMFGEKPMDDGHARSIIMDHCGDSRHGFRYRLSVGLKGGIV